MKKKPSFWDDYIRVLPWNAVALFILLSFFATLQKDVLVFWSFLTGSGVIALLFIMGKLSRSASMKILMYANIVFWSVFVIVATLAKALNKLPF